MNSRFSFDRMNVLHNDRYAKWSAYHWLSTVSLFHNTLFLKLMKILANERPVESHHESSVAKMHENSLFLYKSTKAGTYIRLGRVVDYLNIGFVAMFACTGMLMWLYPMVLNMAVLYHNRIARHCFTWHAELLPHTEQICFLKSKMFGKVQRVYVDIKDLEKIDFS